MSNRPLTRSIALPSHTIGEITRALAHPPQERKWSDLDNANDLAKRIVAAGWASVDQIESLVWFLDRRLYIVHLPRETVEKIIPLETAYYRPRCRATDAFGHRAASAANVALFLMELEQLGFATPADCLVSLLRPALLKRKMLTWPEIRVLWYPDQRKKVCKLEMVEAAV